MANSSSYCKSCSTPEDSESFLEKLKNWKKEAKDPNPGMDFALQTTTDDPRKIDS